MVHSKYPALVVDHKKVQENVSKLVKVCEDSGIFVCGVIKGANGMSSVIDDYVAGGVKMLASSRLEHLERAKETHPEIPRLQIRIPMLSEIEDTIAIADYSLNSEIEVLRALNAEAIKQGRIHKVVLMADLGDLREGYFDHDELVDAAVIVENELDGLYLAGVGTNLGCYGSIVPTEDKMTDLAELAERVEAAVGHELEIVSGGATSSLLAVYGGYMPKKINMLRIGAVNLCGPLEDLRTCYDCSEVDELNDDAFVLEAEVVELKRKASHPVGTLGVDAFGKKGVYVDCGIRARALLAIGRADYGDIADLVPELEGIEVIGASGDHTIIDVEDCAKELKIGDILRFKLKYSAILRISGSENVKVHERSI